MSATKNLSAIPSASEIEIVMDVPDQNEMGEVEEEMTLEEMLKYLSELEATEIMEIVEKANGILKKKWKQIQPTESKLKKMNKPKKPASKALKRNQAWIPFVLKHAMENGWESFTIQQTTKDKNTGEATTEVVKRSGSILNTIDYTFDDVKTKEKVKPAFIFEDTQKHLIFKEAMSLSAKWRYADEKKTVPSDLFSQFLAEYDEPEEEDVSEPVEVDSAPKVMHITAAEKEAEKERKQREKDEEKEQTGLEREVEKERKQREKEEEKEQKRLEREAEKEEKRREKEEKEQEDRKKKVEKEKPAKASPPAKKVVIAKKVGTTPATSSAPAPTPAPTPAKAATASSTTASTPTAKPAAKAVVKAAKPAPKNIPAKPVFDIPADGYAHEWVFEGKTYMANSDREIWTCNAAGEAEYWVGIFLPEENRIDTNAPVPEEPEDE